MTLELTEELKADGWRSIGESGWIVWSQPVPALPGISAYIDLEASKRNEASDSPAYPYEPESPDSDGFVLQLRLCFTRDGQPIAIALSMWIEDEAIAVLTARAHRVTTILHFKMGAPLNKQ